MWGQPPSLSVERCSTFPERCSTSFRLEVHSTVTAQTNLPKLIRHADEFLAFLCLLLASCLPALSQSISAASAPHGAPHDPQTDTAFDHFYNMDYDRAT